MSVVESFFQSSLNAESGHYMPLGCDLYLYHRVPLSTDLCIFICLEAFLLCEKHVVFILINHIDKRPTLHTLHSSCLVSSFVMTSLSRTKK